jgi:hypothetical protein
MVLSHAKAFPIWAIPTNLLPKRMNEHSGSKTKITPERFQGAENNAPESPQYQ